MYPKTFKPFLPKAVTLLKMRTLLTKMSRRSVPIAIVLLALTFWVGSLPSSAQVRGDAPQGRVLGEVEMMLAGAEAGRLDVVVYSLNKGVDPNATGGNGFTALIVAASRGHTSIIDLLLARGANLNKPNNVGWTALMEAAFRDEDRTVMHLLKAGAKTEGFEAKNGLTALMIAAKGDRPDAVTAMLAAGADVKVPDKKRGLTALNYALASPKHSSSEIAVELLVSGADPEHKAKDGYTPLMSAVDSGKLAKISLVLSEKVSVDVQTEDGRRALTIAAGNGHEKLVERLLKAGAKPDSNSAKITALTQALRANSDEAVKFLLKAGADPNRAAADERKPLMLAARAGLDESVRYLLDKGALINGRNKKDGTTALMWAANTGRKRIVEYLIDQGADPSLTAKDGWTAGEAARMAGHVDIADKLERQI
jgi:ankyrin repeat protein